MPLTVPAQNLVVYAEYNTPPTGTNTSLDPDTFYGRDQVELTGGSLTAALAALGLSHSAGVFTALENVTLAVTVELRPKSSLAGDAYAYLSQPDYLINPVLNIPASNTIGMAAIDRVFVMVAGQGMQLGQNCDNGADAPLTYAAMSIVRLI